MLSFALIRGKKEVLVFKVSTDFSQAQKKVLKV